uniref:Uncharacterized protein n=1 Tax=Pseudomonas phage Touem01 TaxID=3138548 RepID=A0AAU6W227_9VIRU
MSDPTILAEQKPAPVIESLVAVEREAAQLGEALQNLISRLEPVLRDGDSSAGITGSVSPPISSTPLAARLDQLCDKITADIGRVNSAIHKLGIQNHR